MSETQLHDRAGRRLSALGEAFSNALCACVIAYCVVSFFAGQAGILAYRDMKSGIEQMKERILVLSGENAKLTDLRGSLSSISVSDRMVREARAIGYLRQDEKMVIFSSTAPMVSDAPRFYETEPLKAGASTGLPDRMIKLLAVMTGLAVLLASLLMSVLPSKRGSFRTTADRS
ncbi:MAG TPA: hypothetical protein VN445_07120 [Rectinemataceae bacterium]|nr:hypothetical protein [Rectinemataceae bacterium]